VASESNHKKQNKEARYLVATRSRGVRVMAPKLNVSGATYTVDMEKQAIRKGLCSIKGIGMKTAECLAKHAPYASVEDLIERTPNKPITGASKGYNGDPASLTGVLGILRDTGLLEPLIYHGRQQ
jgi:DNA polymerase III alpha subunit